MQLIHEHTISSPPVTPINLICVFRDEAILLPHFIDYYQTLGISQFYFIDNSSIDGGGEYIKSRSDINVKLFYTDASFRDSAFGTQWQNKCMEDYCKDQFCIRVDTDELLLLDSRRYPNLLSLIQTMKTTEKTAVPAILLDMYPKQLNNNYQAGQDFSEHSYYFDKLNKDYYRARNIIFQKFYWIEGGLRARTLNTFNTIQKFPIMQYIFNEKTVKPSLHFFSLNGKDLLNAPKIKLMDHPVILLHFKFIKPNFLSYLKTQIDNDEHWRGSVEYKNYYASLKDQKEISFYDEHYSRKFEKIDDLDDFWNINKPLIT